MDIMSLTLSLVSISMMPVVANAITLSSGDGQKIEMTLKDKTICEEKFNSIKIQPYAYSKINYVGNFTQNASNTCGPAAARNLIAGYVWAHDEGGPYRINSLVIPSEQQLSSELGTYSGGTDFGSKWSTVLNKYAPGNNYTLK